MTMREGDQVYVRYASNWIMVVLEIKCPFLFHWYVTHNGAHVSRAFSELEMRTPLQMAPYLLVA